MTYLQIKHLPSQLFNQERWNSSLPRNLMSQRRSSRSISPLNRVFDQSVFSQSPSRRLVDQDLKERLHWLTRPELKVQKSMRSISQEPVIPHHRTRKIKIKEEKGLQRLKVSDLEVSGKKHSDEFCCKEIKKTMNLPMNVKCDELVSFMTHDGKVVLGVPLKISEHKAKSLRSTSPQRSTSPLRRVTDTKTGQMVCIKLPLPQGITPEKINISVSGRELIMRCVDKAITADSTTRINVLNSVTLPENTDFAALKCVKQNGVVVITAPLLSRKLSAMHMPLTHDIADIQHIFSQQDKKKKKKKKQPVLDVRDDVDLMAFQEGINQWPFSTKDNKKLNVKGRNILI